MHCQHAESRVPLRVCSQLRSRPFPGLQCVAVCCSALQCVAVWCSVVQCVAVCCSVLQCEVDSTVVRFLKFQIRSFI